MDTIEVHSIDQFGLVAGMCDDIRLAERIDAVVGRDKRKVSVGTAVKAMILNAMGFTGRALYLTPKFYRRRATETLIGPGISADDLNDACLGTALDALYEAGITELFYHVSSQILAQMGINTRFLHLDSTTFSFFGDAYQAAEQRGSEDEEEAGDMDIQPVMVTHGLSKDHRPELKQLVLQMICTNRSTLPQWIEILSGNSADSTSFPQTIQRFITQNRAAETPWFVMDAAFYSAENLTGTPAEVGWVTRVPERLKEVKDLYQSLDRSQLTEAGDGYWYTVHHSEYAGVPQRWVIVFSKAAEIRELATFEKQLRKHADAKEKQFMHLRNQPFACEKDASQAAEKFAKKLTYQQLSWSIQAKAVHEKKGRPKKSAVPQQIKYFITGELSPNTQAIAAKKKTKGLFIIATNMLDTSQLGERELLGVYKEQGVSVERGFRFLKDPQFYAESLYLKSTKRIMALLMVMTFSLLVYSLTERKLRSSLKEKNIELWDQKNRPYQNPTLRWVFQNFESISVVSQEGPDGPVYQPANLSEFELRVLEALGPPFQKIYFLL
jgi:transposase